MTAKIHIYSDNSRHYPNMMLTRFYRNPQVIFWSIIIVGSILLLCSLRIPKFIDEGKYNELCDNYLEESISKETYKVEVDKITTYKTDIMDLGSGILVFSLCGILFLLHFKIKKWEDFANIKTRGTLFLVILSNLLLVLMILGTYLYYSFRGYRGDYPPFADSIGIPIAQQTALCICLFIPLNLFLLCALFKSKLPTKLFFRCQYPKTGLLWNVFFVLLIILDIFLLLLFILDGDHVSIIVCLCYLYVLLSLRAGKLNFYEYSRQTIKNNS